MAQLTANRNIGRMVDTKIREFPVEAGGHIWRNGWVGIDMAGNAKDFEKGDRLIGLAYEESDNTASGSSAGDTVCRVYVEGDFELTIASVALIDLGAAVFATDDNSTTLTGNADAFVGRVLHFEDTNKAIVRLKALGEMPERGEGGSVYIELAKGHGAGYAHGTGAAAVVTNNSIDGGLLTSVIDGVGITHVTGANGGLAGVFDAVAEVAMASICGGAMLVSEGIYFRMEMHVSDIGDLAVDWDWGLGDMLTAALRLDFAAPAQVAAFHMDAGSANILVQSDDGTTDVALVDSTIDNVVTAGTFKRFEIVVRANGVATLWIDGTQVLSSTTFAMLTTAVVNAFCNMEKSSDNGLGTFVIKSFRCTGGTG